ncbi:MAG: maltose ABC transporter substrate-binding protein [Firmicutes bacterium]|jgi:maltose-binding protein MalE|nr:maltose ABC transporter substrate-binding protein [Bacillota bacterium]NLL08952.1 maltose ABC transporter substrate-binding protein [Bacillota bacterium]HBG10331.1 maltose ABC transporter substrate-binding protein [Bacillota bacterium]
MKKVAALCLVFVLALALSLPAAASVPGELLIWSDGERAPVLTAVARKFVAEYGISVKIQELPFGDIRDNLAIVAPTGEGPDIIVGAHDWLGQLVTDGLIEPIDIEDPSLFVQSALDAFTWGGQYYGIPYAIESIGLFYNKDLVGEDGIGSFEELEELTKNELAPKGIYGLVLPQPDPYHTFPFFSVLGGYVFGFDEEGALNALDVGLANAGAVEGFEYFEKLLDEGVIARATPYDTMMSLFQNGQAATMMTGPWAFGDVRAAGVNYGFTQIPSYKGQFGKPFLGAQGFMVSAFSENKMLANIFLNEFVATKDTMLAIYEGDPRPTAFLPAAEIINEDPDMRGVMEAAEKATPMPQIPAMNSVWTAWSDAIELVINQQAAPKAAIENAVETIIQTIRDSM